MKNITFASSLASTFQHLCPPRCILIPYQGDKNWHQRARIGSVGPSSIEDLKYLLINVGHKLQKPLKIGLLVLEGRNNNLQCKMKFGSKTQNSNLTPKLSVFALLIHNNISRSFLVKNNAKNGFRECNFIRWTILSFRKFFRKWVN